MIIVLTTLVVISQVLLKDSDISTILLTIVVLYLYHCNPTTVVCIHWSSSTGRYDISTRLAWGLQRWTLRTL